MRLWALFQATEVRSKKISGVIIADPYLMNEENLKHEEGRRRMKSYLLDFMQQNKVKNFLLVPYRPMYVLLWLYTFTFVPFLHICCHVSKFVTLSWLRYVYSVLRNNHWVLLVLRPQRCNCYLLDSTKSPGKDWSLLKDLLDDCLFDWNTTRGHTVEKNYKGSGKKMIAFRWNTLSCMQQPRTSLTCDFYARIQMKKFIWSTKMLNQHDKILKWGQEVQNNHPETGLVLEELQVKLAAIINKEVRSSFGLFYNNFKEDESNQQKSLT